MSTDVLFCNNGRRNIPQMSVEISPMQTGSLLLQRVTPAVLQMEVWVNVFFTVFVYQRKIVMSGYERDISRCEAQRIFGDKPTKNILFCC